MKRIRVIPVLLLDGQKLVKGIKFKSHVYVGDPINTLKIFNDKEVDEIIVLDISATGKKKAPDYALISLLSEEIFMPLAYGGGITSAEEIKKILGLGIEKVILNSILHVKPEIIKEASRNSGSQSIVASLDVKKNFWGKYEVWTNSGRINTRKDPLTFAMKMEELGAGEIYLQSINKEGTLSGYDLELLKKVSERISIPVIAGGGAASVSDFFKAVESGGASAVSAGAKFVFIGPHKAVLINYPGQEELKKEFFNKIS